jgi:hypothetical protein
MKFLHDKQYLSLSHIFKHESGQTAAFVRPRVRVCQQNKSTGRGFRPGLLGCALAWQVVVAATFQNRGRSRDTSVNIAATGWPAMVRFQVVVDFALLHSAQTESGARSASYPMGTGGSFLGGKDAGA